MKDLHRFIFLSGILVFFIAVQPAHAFEITPVKFLLTVEPGTSQTVIVKIRNTPPFIPPPTAVRRGPVVAVVKEEGQGLPAPLSGAGVGLNLAFKLSVLGMKQDEEGRPVFFRGTDVAENWVYPENNLVNIKANETKSVNFIIKIPADALAGSHYLGLAVEPVLAKGDQVSLQTRLVSLLTLQVKGLVEESVAIEKWVLREEAKDSSKNWKFDLSLKNSGTIEVLLRGTIAVRNWQGEQFFSEPIILGNKLLAGSRRVLQPEVTLRNDINLPGLYSAQIKINYGRTNQTVSAIAYVWYFPMWSRIFLAGLVVLVVLVVVVLFRRKKY